MNILVIMHNKRSFYKRERERVSFDHHVLTLVARLLQLVYRFNQFVKESLDTREYDSVGEDFGKMALHLRISPMKLVSPRNIDIVACFFSQL